jgi:hypothetical protein
MTTMPFILRLQRGAKATVQQLEVFKHQSGVLCDRLLYAKVTTGNVLVIDCKTKAGYYVRKSYDNKGNLVSRVFYKEYDLVNHTPMISLFE